MSPSAGWAKIKETNPDEYRNPRAAQPRAGRGGGPGGRDQGFNRNQQQQRQGRGGGRLGGNRPLNRGVGLRGPGPFGDGGGARPEPFVAGMGPGAAASGPQTGPGGLPLDLGLGGIISGMSDTDPKTVETIIIPQIINQAQEGLRDGRIKQEQFSDLMKQVMILKEQAMIRQADRRHLQMENKENQHFAPGGGGPRPDGPWDPRAAAVGPMHRPPMGFMGPPMRPGMPFGPRMMPPFGPAGPPMGMMEAGMPPPDVNLRRDLPPASEEDLELLRHDPAKTISIDNLPRDIRYYGETATSVMEDNEVRELSFERPPEGSGPATRRVFVDDDPNVVPPLEVDSKEYTDFTLNGIHHKIRIGAPTRELWVDGQWHEAYFDKCIRIRIGQSFHTVLLEGPPPSVHIGEVRPDLCAGFVRAVHNGQVHDWRKVYLDGKPQLLEIGGKPHVFRFVEGLRTLLINGHPHKPDFGGLPIVLYVCGVKHYLRLSALPAGVTMENALAPRNEDGTSSVSGQSEQQQQDFGFDSEGHTSAFDRLLKLFPNADGQKRDADTASESDYNVSGGGGGQDTPVRAPKPEPESPEASGNHSVAASPAVNVHDLWSQLLGAGLVKTNEDDKKAAAGPIPGLDVTKTPEAAKKSPAAVKTEADAAPGPNQKPSAPTDAAPAPAVPKVEAPVPVNIKLVSHHTSLKE